MLNTESMLTKLSMTLYEQFVSTRNHLARKKRENPGKADVQYYECNYYSKNLVRNIAKFFFLLCCCLYLLCNYVVWSIMFFFRMLFFLCFNNSLAFVITRLCTLLITTILHSADHTYLQLCSYGLIFDFLCQFFFSFIVTCATGLI